MPIPTTEQLAQLQRDIDQAAQIVSSCYDRLVMFADDADDVPDAIKPAFSAGRLEVVNSILFSESVTLKAFVESSRNLESL